MYILHIDYLHPLSPPNIIYLHTHIHNIPLKTNQNVEQVNSHQNRFYNNFCEKKYRFEKPIKMYLKKMWQKSDFQNKPKKNKQIIKLLLGGDIKKNDNVPRDKCDDNVSAGVQAKYLGCLAPPGPACQHYFS